MGRMGFGAALLCSGLLSCGGTQKGAAQSGPSADESAEASESEDGEGQGNYQGASPEKYDELQSAFRMKRPMVARCLNEAVAAGTVDKKAKGRVTLAMTISPDGKAQDVKVTETTLRARAVEDCVIETVQSWTLPQPGVPTEFSFSYEFEGE